MGICDGRVVIVTGAGRGLGRAYAMAFAAAGASVVVNDLGGGMFGGGKDRSLADTVVDEIRAAGGKAVANHDDVADWDGARRIIDTAIENFGDLHVVVNNAGIIRLVPFEDETPENWDLTMRVHLRGSFCVGRHAVGYWRDRHNAGKKVSARIINISSGAGLQGGHQEAAYGSAKAGLAALTLIQAAELGKYGITANAIAPTARTRMTEEYWPQFIVKANHGFDVMDPENVAPTLVWLGSEESSHVTGCVFELGGGLIALEDGWDLGPSIDIQRRWEPEEIGHAVGLLLSRRKKPRPVWPS